MELKGVVKIITVIDVILAAVLITLYVSLLSNHLQDLQLEKRSKRDHVILYIYVCVSVLFQLFFAFQFYRVLSFSNDDDDELDEEDVEEQLRIAKYWTIASYVILLNFLVKTGVYSTRCRCVISLTLGVYFVAIFFRICSIYTVKLFISKLEKMNEETKRKQRLRQVMVHHYLYR